jgi:putative peptidoglycan lipid II flippase
MGAMLARSLQRVLFLAVIGAAGLAVAAEPIVFLIFQRGAFTVADAEMTSTLLVCFAFGLTAWSAQALAARGFYARQDTLTPMIVGTVVVAVSLPVYLVLVDRFDVVGLATASSIAMTLSAVTTIGVYRWRAGTLPLLPLAKGFGRGLLVAALAGGAAGGARWLSEPLISPDSTLSWLALGMTMGVPFGVVVLGIASVAGFDEIDLVTNRLKRLVGRLRPS